MATPGRLRPHPAAVIVAALIVSSAFMLAGCGGGDGGKRTGPAVVRAASAGAPRSVRIGFSSLPAERTTAANIEAFATAAQYGDIVMIERTPPWEEFLPGGHVSKTTQQDTSFETTLLDQYSALQRFYIVDPTDGAVQRARIANLPAGIDAQAGFNDPRLRQAFIAYVTYVISNYKPDYLALGSEINMLFERNPRQFDAFVSLYREAYTVAKAASPKTKVFPTFELEDLLGTFGTAHSPHWEVLDAFRGSMDALAISSYPYLGGIASVADLPADYFTQVQSHWKGEILVAETGYASAPVEGEVNIGTEDDQAAYVQRLLSDADAAGFSTVIWLAARDPSFAASGTAVVFKDIGLRKGDGSNKVAWSTWEEWARRPLK
jgi:hypothetical protein